MKVMHSIKHVYYIHVSPAPPKKQDFKSMFRYAKKNFRYPSLRRPETWRRQRPPQPLREIDLRRARGAKAPEPRRKRCEHLPLKPFFLKRTKIQTERHRWIQPNNLSPSSPALLAESAWA